MLKTLTRSPAAAFAALALLTLAVLAVSAFAVARIPDASLHVRLAGDGKVAVEGRGPYPMEQRVSFRDRHGVERLAHVPLKIMATDLGLRGTPEENRQASDMLTKIGQLVREPGMQLRLPDGVLLPAYAIDRGWAGMKAGTWLVLAIGLCASLVGFWVWVLRPREWAARMFLISGLSLMAATVTIAAVEQLSIAVSLGVYLWTNHLNYLISSSFGLSLAALFARYPWPLIPKRVLSVVAVGLVLFWIVCLFDLWTDVFQSEMALVAMLGVAIIVLALLQGWKSRHDPALRAPFILIGASLLVCIVLFFSFTLIPQMLGTKDLVPLPVATSVFLLFYLALAVGIARYRLFDLGGWAINIAVMAMAIVVVLVVDFLLVLFAGGSWTLSTAFLSVALAWLPLRELLLRRTDRRRNRRDISLLRGASEVAFALHPDQQARIWENLLQNQFAPLTIGPCACLVTEIREDGRVLAVPSPLDGSGLALSFAGHGSRLFNSEDKQVAGALVSLVEEMVAARAAYDRGVRAERQRIARDLHDDVGARLMTTLHRDDLGTVHADVREAMADMRLIIDGMEGQSRRFADIIADLRHETVNRLQLASIKAVWPVDALFDDERPVAAELNRALFSVVRELVSNIIRHSGADAVGLACKLEDDVLTLAIRDNGCGFDGADSANLGNGLRNIRKRLDEVGGAMDVQTDGSGTLTSLRLPLASLDHGMAGDARIA